MSDKDTRWFAPKPFGLGVRILTRKARSSCS